MAWVTKTPEDIQLILEGDGNSILSVTLGTKARYVIQRQDGSIEYWMVSP